MTHFKSKIALASSAALLALTPFGAQADLHKASVGVSYFDQTQELSLLGSSVDVDADGTVFSGTYFLTENLSLEASFLDGDLDDAPIDIESTSFGVVYHVSRTDLRTGEGTGAAIGISALNSEVEWTGVGSSDEDYTYGSVGLSTGLGNGLSATAAYSTDLEEFGDTYSMSVGIGQAFGDLLLTATYAWGEEETGTIIESETDGFSIGVSYLY